MSKNLVNKLFDTLESGELLNIVDSSLAASQVLEKLGYSNKGQYVGIVKQFLSDYEVDTSHFTPNGRPLVSKITKICPVCSVKFSTHPRKDKEQVTCSLACSNTYFRTKNTISISNYRKKAISHYGCFCNRCGFNNEKALQAHHKDRDRENNSLDNLEVLCANCHTIEHMSD